MQKRKQLGLHAWPSFQIWNKAFQSLIAKDARVSEILHRLMFMGAFNKAIAVFLFEISSIWDIVG